MPEENQREGVEKMIDEEPHDPLRIVLIRLLSSNREGRDFIRKETE